MKTYELAYLIAPELSEEEAKSLSQNIAEMILSEGGSVDKTEEPKKRTLAYQIKKRKEAYFVFSNFHLAPEKLAGLEKMIKGKNQILRYLIVAKIPSRMIEKPRRVRIRKETTEAPAITTEPKKEKVELKEIEKKLEEILGQ